MNETDKKRMEKIWRYYNVNGIMPTFEDIMEITGIKSKNGVSKFIERMIELQKIRKIGQRIAPGLQFFA